MQKKKIQKFTRIKRAGFTLIELLVVISIVGLLSSVLLVSLNSARVRARDAKRIADLSQFVKGLEVFHSRYSMYPCGDSSDGTNMVDSSYSEPFLNGGTAGGGPPPQCTEAPVFGLYGAGIVNNPWIKAINNETNYYFYEIVPNRQSYVLYTRLEHESNASRMANDGGQCANYYEVWQGTARFTPSGVIWWGVPCN